jgi:uncharacterized membrane protein
VDRGRLEAFSDGVLAIIITIMVLELGVPHEPTLEALRGLAPVFVAYVLSFVYVAIYWNNHHHLLKTVHTISGGIMWANMGLLFCLSLFPFATAWMGENHLEAWPLFVYGLVLLSAALAYYLLQTVIVHHEGGRSSAVGRALGRDFKGRLSPFAYVAAMALAFVAPWVSSALYVGVALTWLVPDRRLAGLATESERADSIED